MDAATVERENRWRLETLLHVCEQHLQQRTQRVWDARPASDVTTLARALPPFQRVLVAKQKRVAIDTWDVTMCNAVLKHFAALTNEKDIAAVMAIVNARNHCSHAAAGRVTTAMFEKHATSCEQALARLGGDVAALQRLRVCEIDADSVGMLSCSVEATKLADTVKLEGNRLFRESDLVGARACYTKGIQLYNNRATASFRLGEFKSAKEDAKHAAELAPHWAKPHLHLAQIYYEQYKPHKAVARLEIALGYATAANDTAVMKEVTAKMAEYRLERDQAARRESENLSYGPMHGTEGAARAAIQARLGMTDKGDPMTVVDCMMNVDMSGTGFVAKKHVLIGQRAATEGRLADAAREFMAAAMAGDPEGMYNYAVSLLSGRGIRKNIPEAVRWLEKAAAMPTTDSPASLGANTGIGEAMATLGNLCDSGVDVPQNKQRAREFWQRSAELGAEAGLNNFGLCLLNGTHGVEKDLPRAREMFRRSAEAFNNDAMFNLSTLHATLHEYDTAARWADAAFKFGLLPATAAAAKFRELAKERTTLHPVAEKFQAKLISMVSLTVQQPSLERSNESPTLAELRQIGTPYGKRLLCAKERIMKAMDILLSGDPATMDDAIDLAAQAHRIDDSSLVFSQADIRCTIALVEMQQALRSPVNADHALMSSPMDPSSAIAFWNSQHLKHPADLEIAKRAACLHFFAGYAGASRRRGLELFQHAFSLLPKPEDDSDPRTLDLLYVTGAAYFQTYQAEVRGQDSTSINAKRAEELLARFLKWAPLDGHRKGAEANYILGQIAIYKQADASRNLPDTVAQYLREGDRLLERIPKLLRTGAEASPNRTVLQKFAGLDDIVSVLKSDSLAVPGTLPRRRGGELIDGPRRHAALQWDFPTLQSTWRAKIAHMTEIASNRQGSGMSFCPPRRATRANRGNVYSQATIDELLSGLEDRVYTGRVITCIVVSLPGFNGSSFHFVVEDSQREPSRIALYNATESLISQLVPGSEFERFDPYVRIAHDGSVMLRVDDPSTTIEVKTCHGICWVCSVEHVGTGEVCEEGGRIRTVT